MYMSYCRFEGTRMELNACLNDVEEHVNGEAEYPVSENEVNHFRWMVENFAGWLHDMALLDDEGYLDEDALNEVCDDMMKGKEDNEDEAC